MRPPLLLAGHGSADATGAAAFAAFVARVAAIMAAESVDVAGGFIELSAPPLSAAVAELLDRGHRHVAAVPVVLAAAGHAKGDIPAALAAQRARHPGLSFAYGRPLGPHPALLHLLTERIAAVLPDRHNPAKVAGETRGPGPASAAGPGGGAGVAAGDEVCGPGLAGAPVVPDGGPGVVAGGQLPGLCGEHDAAGAPGRRDPGLLRQAGRLPGAGTGSREPTAVLVVGRGSTDPDANAELYKTTRLLWETASAGEPPIAFAETAYVSLAAPSVAAGLERCRRLGARRIVVARYFLFPGVLPDRVAAQARGYAAAHADLDIRCTDVLGDCDILAAIAVERYQEALAGDIRMNCDMCMYRTPLPGFEDRVGAPQRPHHHPGEPAGSLAAGHGHVH